MWPPTSLPWGLFLGPKKKTFKPPYLKITFGTNTTFLQNTAELIIKDGLKTLTAIGTNLNRDLSMILTGLIAGLECCLSMVSWT